MFGFLSFPEQIWQEFVGTAVHITARQQVLVADVVTPPPYRRNLFQKIPTLFIPHLVFFVPTSK